MGTSYGGNGGSIYLYSGNTTQSGSNGGDILLYGGAGFGSSSSGGNVSIVGGLSKTGTGGNIVSIIVIISFDEQI